MSLRKYPKKYEDLNHNFPTEEVKASCDGSSSFTDLADDITDGQFTVKEFRLPHSFTI